MQPVPRTEDEGLRYYLAPYVSRTITTRCSSDLPLFSKRDYGGATLRLSLRSVVSRYLNPLDARSFQGAFSLDTPFALVQLTKAILQGSTSKLDLVRAEGELGTLVSQLLEKVSSGGWAVSELAGAPYDIGS